jgi:hypothetical protein
MTDEQQTLGGAKKIHSPESWTDIKIDKKSDV